MQSAQLIEEWVSPESGAVGLVLCTAWVQLHREDAVLVSRHRLCFTSCTRQRTVLECGMHHQRLHCQRLVVCSKRACAKTASVLPGWAASKGGTALLGQLLVSLRLAKPMLKESLGSADSSICTWIASSMPTRAVKPTPRGAAGMSQLLPAVLAHFVRVGGFVVPSLAPRRHQPPDRLVCSCMPLASWVPTLADGIG